MNCILYFLDVVLALLEALKQLHHEYRKDNDFCKDVKLEKAVRHWAAILSGFSSFPEGKAALCEYNVRSLKWFVHKSLCFYFVT